jgi:hypothetical protein
MKKIIFEIRMLVVIILVKIIINILPKEATETLVWMAKMPFEKENFK